MFRSALWNKTLSGMALWAFNGKFSNSRLPIWKSLSNGVRFRVLIVDLMWYTNLYKPSQQRHRKIAVSVPVCLSLFKGRLLHAEFLNEDYADEIISERRKMMIQ